MILEFIVIGCGVALGLGMAFLIDWFQEKAHRKSLEPDSFDKALERSFPDKTDLSEIDTDMLRRIHTHVKEEK